MRAEPVLTELSDKYLELEFARFMRLYGTRVPVGMIDLFMQLIRVLHEFKAPPLFAVLKEYEVIASKELQAFQEV